MSEKNTEKKDILSLNEAGLKAFAADMGLPGYRAGQIFSWLHKNNARDFSEMSNIPQTLREELKLTAAFRGCGIAKKICSKTDSTVKYLFEVSGGFIEAVVMRYDYGNTVCVSSQLGCAFGCAFCASAADGFTRNLTAGEMLSQVYEAERDIGERVSNIVIMGTGEPLENLKNVLRFIENINSKNGKNIGIRGITLSTCGIPRKITELAKLKLGIGLAISLHAADDILRKRLMPAASVYPIKELIGAADTYFELTGRRVTWEYMLLGGVNDTKQDALKLSALLKSKNAHVNIITYNRVPKSVFEPSRKDKAFLALLRENGVNATLRKSKGGDIDGACGQLRISANPI